MSGYTHSIKHLRDSIHAGNIKDIQEIVKTKPELVTTKILGNTKYLASLAAELGEFEAFKYLFENTPDTVRYTTEDIIVSACSCTDKTNRDLILEYLIKQNYQYFDTNSPALIYLQLAVGMRPTMHIDKNTLSEPNDLGITPAVFALLSDQQHLLYSMLGENYRNSCFYFNQIVKPQDLTDLEKITVVNFRLVLANKMIVEEEFAHAEEILKYCYILLKLIHGQDDLCYILLARVRMSQARLLDSKTQPKEVLLLLAQALIFINLIRDKLNLDWLVSFVDVTTTIMSIVDKLDDMPKEQEYLKKNRQHLIAAIDLFSTATDVQDQSECLAELYAALAEIDANHGQNHQATVYQQSAIDAFSKLDEAMKRQKPYHAYAIRQYCCMAKYLISDKQFDATATWISKATSNLDQCVLDSTERWDLLADIDFQGLRLFAKRESFKDLNKAVVQLLTNTQYEQTSQAETLFFSYITTLFTHFEIDPDFANQPAEVVQALCSTVLFTNKFSVETNHYRRLCYALNMFIAKQYIFLANYDAASLTFDVTVKMYAEINDLTDLDVINIAKKYFELALLLKEQQDVDPKFTLKCYYNGLRLLLAAPIWYLDQFIDQLPKMCSQLITSPTKRLALENLHKKLVDRQKEAGNLEKIADYLQMFFNRGLRSGNLALVEFFVTDLYFPIDRQAHPAVTENESGEPFLHAMHSRINPEAIIQLVSSKQAIDDVVAKLGLSALCSAAKADNLVATRWLCEEKHVDFRQATQNNFFGNNKGLRPEFFAALSNGNQVLDYFLTKKKINAAKPLTSGEHSGLDLQYWIASYGDIAQFEIVYQHLGRLTTCTARNCRKAYNAIHATVESGEYELFVYLFKRDIIPSSQTDKYHSFANEQLESIGEDEDLELINGLRNIINFLEYEQKLQSFKIDVKKDNVAGLKMRLKNSKKLLSQPLTNNSDSWMHVAAQYNSHKTIEWLCIECPGQLTQLNGNDELPLVIAFRKGHVEAVRVLLTHKNKMPLDPATQNKIVKLAVESRDLELICHVISEQFEHDGSPITLQSNLKGGLSHYVRELITKAGGNTILACFKLACESKQAGLAKALYETHYKLLNSNYALHIACESGDLSTVKAITAIIRTNYRGKQKKELVNKIRKSDGNRPFHVACQQDNPDVILHIVKELNLDNSLGNNNRRKPTELIADQKVRDDVEALFLPKPNPKVKPVASPQRTTAATTTTAKDCEVSPEAEKSPSVSSIPAIVMESVIFAKPEKTKKTKKKKKAKKV